MFYKETAERHFVCVGCNKDDRLTYNEAAYTIVCRACGITYSIDDISKMGQQDFWLTKDQRAIPISQMEDSHLNNAIAMLISHPDRTPGMLEKLVEELERRR